jgi:hypothetical protein
VADTAHAGVLQDPPYDEDRMLTRLIRAALLHRESERRHLGRAADLVVPFVSAVTDELLARLGENIYPGWMPAYVDDESDDVSTFVIQGLGHQSYSTTSDQAIRLGSTTSGRPGSGRRCAPWHVRLTRPARHRQGQGRAGPAEGRSPVVDGAGARDYVVKMGSPTCS